MKKQRHRHELFQQLEANDEIQSKFVNHLIRKSDENT